MVASSTRVEKILKCLRHETEDFSQVTAGEIDDALETYEEKRDFDKTPEPRGRVRSEAGRRYVVQKHAARRLHFDFRLEWEGVLKSWAVTRGPSLDPTEKRLAVRTEDHPVSYADFEGVIPSGYGAGVVMLWDEGRWEPVNDPASDFDKGVLKIRLMGQRLRGSWMLVRMRPKPGEKRENWLLIKEKDRYAEKGSDVVERFPASVSTGRSLEEIKNDVAPNSPVRKGRRSIPASFIKPQLATLVEHPPEGEHWLHELKYDGYRIQCLLNGGNVRLLTRNGNDWTERYPAIAARLARLTVDSAVLDGELVALDAEGRSDFGALQAPRAGQPLAYFAFDLLQLDGEELAGLPLDERKSLLQALVGKGDGVLRFSDHITGSGEGLLGKACAMGLEGLVSKMRDAPYRPGRSRAWLKSKCVGNDEFVIGGYRKSGKAGRPFSSLLIGEYVNGKLEYRGRVGTGFNETALQRLAAAMEPLERATAPFDTVPPAARNRAVWLQPRLLAQVRYAEKTGQGVLRHPSFLGLREDKEVHEMKNSESTEKPSSSERAEDRTEANGATRIEGVRLTSPDKVMFPRQGATKRDVASYYQRHGERVLQFAKNRPLSLVRCPAGRDDDCFFQRHHRGSLPAHLHEIEIREKSGKPAAYLFVRSVKGLVATAQVGALELHLWGVRTDRLERPERVVFDLDPDEGLSFDDVRRASLELRDVLAAAGLETFPLLTGGKGVHVIAPLVRRREWGEVKMFARGLARRLAEAAPDRYVATASKEKRKDRIFIDWLRNERGGTAIAPYSPRARPGAPVATPVSWAELKRIESARAYTLDNIDARLSNLEHDPWKGYHELRQSITQAHLRMLA